MSARVTRSWLIAGEIDVTSGANSQDWSWRQAEAVSHFKTAVRLEPENPGARLNLGVALAQIPGRLPHVIAEFAAAVRLNPVSAEAHFSLGMALWRALRTADARAEFKAAVRLRSDWAEGRQLAEQTRT